MTNLTRQVPSERQGKSNDPRILIYAEDDKQAAQKTITAPRLVVIMPALNEEATIASVIEKIPRSIEGVAEVEVLVVDDGSTDKTVELSRQADAHVVSHTKNMGVGKAFATGIGAALKLGADIIVNMDSDGQFRPEDIPALIRPILEEGYGFVTCTRFSNPDYTPEMPGIKKWGNRMMCHLVNRIIGNTKFTDVSCGFRAYTRDTALRLNLFGGFTYTQESFIDLAFKDIRMTEVSLKVRGVREFGKSRVASNLWKYAFETLPIIVLAMRDTRPLAFFGIFALVFFVIGTAQAAFVTGWWFMTGLTSPWTSLVTISTGFLLLGVIIAIMALIADQLGRVKKIQEEILLSARKLEYGPTVLDPRLTEEHLPQLQWDKMAMHVPSDAAGTERDAPAVSVMQRERADLDVI